MGDNMDYEEKRIDFWLNCFYKRVGYDGRLEQNAALKYADELLKDFDKRFDKRFIKGDKR